MDRDTGQSRVPAPPDKITGTTVPSVSDISFEPWKSNSIQII
jgi:hypothetical protein